MRVWTFPGGTSPTARVIRDNSIWSRNLGAFPIPVANLKRIVITAVLNNNDSSSPGIDINLGVTNGPPLGITPDNPNVVFNDGGVGRLLTNAPPGTSVTYEVTAGDLARMKAAGGDLRTWCTGGTSNLGLVDIALTITFYE